MDKCEVYGSEIVLEIRETRENRNKSWRSCKYFRPHLFLFLGGMWICDLASNITFHTCANFSLRCWFTFTNPPPTLLPVTGWCLCGNFLSQISDHLARRRVLQMHLFADFSGSRTRKQKFRDGSASRRSLQIAAVVFTSRSCVPK